MEFDLEAINLLAKPVLMSPRFRRDHCTVNHSKLINLLLNLIHLLEFLKQNRFFSHRKETNQPWIFCNLSTAQFKVKSLIEMLLKVKALTFYAHKIVCFIFKDLTVCCWQVCLNNRPKFPSAKPKLLDLKGLLVDPCSWVWLQSRLSFQGWAVHSVVLYWHITLLYGEVEFLFRKMNLISHANMCIHTCNYENGLFFGLHYLAFLFNLN